MAVPMKKEPPSSLPGLKNMEQTDLAEMLKTIKAPAECMARTQALQSEENARIMSLPGFLTESLSAADDNLDEAVYISRNDQGERESQANV